MAYLGSVMQTRELLNCKRWQASIGSWSNGYARILRRMAIPIVCRLL